MLHQAQSFLKTSLPMVNAEVSLSRPTPEWVRLERLTYEGLHPSASLLSAFTANGTFAVAAPPLPS